MFDQNVDVVEVVEGALNLPRESCKMIEPLSQNVPAELQLGPQTI